MSSSPPPPALTSNPAERRSPLHTPSLHESGLSHTTGEALYVDDVPLPPGALVGHVVVSPHAHARIVRRSGDLPRAVPGIHCVLFAEDIPGDNQVGPVVHDEPLLATDTVLFKGQSVALVVGESLAVCRRAAA